MPYKISYNGKHIIWSVGGGEGRGELILIVKNEVPILVSTLILHTFFLRLFHNYVHDGAMQTDTCIKEK
jgi:hypothetical protein